MTCAIGKIYRFHGALVMHKQTLTAVAESESGMWLDANPVSSLRTQLGADTLTAAVALSIRAPLGEPHVCRLIANANTLGLYNLACRFSAGRLARHSELNDEVKRALQTPGIPCLIEPPVYHRMASQCLRINMKSLYVGIALA